MTTNFEIRRKKSSKRKILWCKKAINISDVNVDNIVISKLVETNDRYLIGYLDKVIRPVDLVLPKMTRYVKTWIG